MTVVNPKSISGINSITMASGSDNLLTIHTTNTTERVRVNSDGDVIVGSGITVSPDGDIFATGVTTSTTFVGNLTGNVTGTASANAVLTGSTNNTVCTVTGANAIQGESNFSYDGTKCLIGTSTGAPYANRNLTVAQGGSGNTTVAIEVRSPTNGDGRIVFTDSTSDEAGAYKGQIRYDQTNDFMSFNTNGDNERLRITSSGQMVMGATTSKAKFEIKDNGYTSSTVLQRISTDDANPYALIIANDTCNTSAASGMQIFLGDSGSHYIRARGSSTAGNNNLLIQAQNDIRFGSGSSETERLRITSAGKFGFNNTDPSAEIEVTFDSGGSAPSSGTAPEGIAISYGTADGKNGGIWFSPGFGDDQGISGICGTRVNGYDTDLRFYTNNTSSARAFSERMRIDNNGKTAIGTNSPDSVYRTTIQEDTSGHGVLLLNRTSNVDSTYRDFVLFKRSGTTVGSIKVNNSGTQYNTSSDHRLKENVVTMSNATNRLKQLQPKRFNFILNPDITVDGFLAHEVQSVVPEAISGTKDEVDSDNNPVYQGIDQSKLVPLLTAALQEAVTKIEVLETRLNNAGIAT